MTDDRHAPSRVSGAVPPPRVTCHATSHLSGATASAGFEGSSGAASLARADLTLPANALSNQALRGVGPGHAGAAGEEEGAGAGRGASSEAAARVSALALCLKAWRAATERKREE